jgi:hypothetical protein
VSRVNLEEAAWIAVVVSTLVAGGSAVVAVLARQDAKRSAAAAERSAQAAEDLTAIERRRQHVELTPQCTLDVACRGPGSDRIRVTVRLNGPAGLDRLDQLSVRVRDDKDRSPVTAGGPTQEQIAATIWAPYRFVPGVDGADPLGRAIPDVALARGESRTLEMEPTVPPAWVSDAQWWRREYADLPILLEITCVLGERRWRIPVEHAQPQPRFAATTYGDEPIEVVARNVGTAPAKKVSFRPSADDPTVVVRGAEKSVVDVGESASAYVLLFDQSTATSIDLVWTDHLGVPRRQAIDIHGT